MGLSEAPSNEYPQHMSLWRNKENINTLSHSAVIVFFYFLIEVLKPSQPIKVMSSHSVYQTTLFLGRSCGRDLTNDLPEITGSVRENSDGISNLMVRRK